MGSSSLAAFTVSTLPWGYEYSGPDGSSGDDSDLCKCNTVTYSLLSACDLCQGEWFISYDLLRLCRSSFMYLPSGGLNGWPTAVQPSLLRRELRQSAEGTGIDGVIGS